MCKKIIGLGLGIVMAMGLLFGTDALSYVTTSANQVTTAVNDNVPIDFKINRAQTMVASLQPEIRKNMHLIAKEEVEVDRIARQIDQLDSKLAKDRANMEKISVALDTGQDYIQLASRRYSRNQVKHDLTSRLSRAKTREATLNQLTRIKNAREQKLNASRQKLNGILSARQTLQVELEELQARHRMNEVAQATSELSIDDSVLAKVQDCFDDLETQIAANERFLSVEGEFQYEIPVDVEPQVDDADIMDQVAAFLGKDTAPLAEIIAVADLDIE